MIFDPNLRHISAKLFAPYSFFEFKMEDLGSLAILTASVTCLSSAVLWVEIISTFQSSDFIVEECVVLE